MDKDKLIEFAKEQCEIFPEDSYMGKYLRETIKILQAEPCEDAVSRKKIEKLKRWRFPYDTKTTIPKSDLFVKLTDIRALPSVKSTQGWIPCSERLPKERGMYIVTEKVFSVTDKEHTGGFNLMTEQVEFDNGKWRRASFYEVIAWMPLLKPYQKESEEKQ